MLLVSVHLSFLQVARGYDVPLKSHYEFRKNLHQMGSQMKTQLNLSWNIRLSVPTNCNQPPTIPGDVTTGHHQPFLMVFDVWWSNFAGSVKERHWYLWRESEGVAGGAAERLSPSKLHCRVNARNFTKTWEKNQILKILCSASLNLLNSKGVATANAARDNNILCVQNWEYGM